MRMIVFTAAITTLFALLIIGACAYGVAQPQTNTLRELGFDVCQGKPCYHGIVPGVTDWKSLNSTLASLGRTDDGKKYYDFLQGDQGDKASMPARKSIVVSVRDDLSDIPSVNIFFGDMTHALTVADLISVMGPPCKVTVFPNLPVPLWLVYPSLLVGTEAMNFDLDAAVVSMKVIDPLTEKNFGSISKCGQPESEQYITTSWHGFASFSFYKAHMHH